MAKRVAKSRLKETAFSQYNLRDAYITDLSSYHAAIRDEAIFSNYGIKALVRVPAIGFEDNENNVDEYNNFVDIEWNDTTETVVPLFKEYLENVNANGMGPDMDGIFGLEVLIPTKLHLPRNSRIVFTEYNSRDERIAREWVVLSTVMKQLSGGKTYSRIANCVPARQGTYDTGDLNGPNTIWFDYKVDEHGFNKLTDIRAQGTIWFNNIPIDRTQSIRAIKAEIYERLPEFPEIIEQVEIPIFYDTRPKYIIEPGVGFNIGEEYDILDDNGNPVYVQISDKGEKVALVLTVKAVNSLGGICEFALNVERGFTPLGEDGDMEIELVKDEAFPAKIMLTSIYVGSDLYNEVLSADVITKPKYLVPYRLDAALIAKTISASVTS